MDVSGEERCVTTQNRLAVVRSEMEVVTVVDFTFGSHFTVGVRAGCYYRLAFHRWLTIITTGA